VVRIRIIATTIISVLIWKEKINGDNIIGIVLILAGVVILNLFGPGHGDEANKEISVHEEI